MKKVVDMRNARDIGYRSVLEDITKKGKCPFCPKNFLWHRRPILKRRGNWFITGASWPYENTRHHLLIIGREHKEKMGLLTSLDLKEIFGLVDWAVKKFNVRGGALALRFGDTRFTGATVYHLHFHLIIPKLGKNNRALVVNFPIG
jgi:diadenosine tetraphosphate (Ap4A) HIT family hydrolase